MRNKEKIVKVDWVDISSDSSWMGRKKVISWGNKSCGCSSVGYLIEKNKNNLVIASMKEDEGGQYSLSVKIPLNNITKITELKI